jgi:hypothetical protein
MEYGKIVNRSASIVWRNKFLIILGIIASLASGSFSSGGSGSGGSGGGESFGGIEQLTEAQEAIAGLTVGVFIALGCVVLFFGIVLWAISTIARGGMVASVDNIESGEKSSFTRAWSAGWHRAWTLLGIGIIPGIPGLILFVVGLMALGAYGGVYALFGEGISPAFGAGGLGIAIVCLACFFVPLMLVLSILRNFAERACMLEDLGVLDSYRRGTRVLMSNIGEAIILFLIQIGIFIVLGLLLFVPGVILIFCCCLWPLLFVVQGAISAFLSALWTLAWRTWTGEPPLVEKAPAAV